MHLPRKGKREKRGKYRERQKCWSSFVCDRKREFYFYFYFYLTSSFISALPVRMSLLCVGNLYPQSSKPQLTHVSMSHFFYPCREFYYIQMEKYARQAVSEGITRAEDIEVTMDSELLRVLNLHYNRNNHIEVSTRDFCTLE